MRININDIVSEPKLIRQKKAENVSKQSGEYLRDSLKNVGMKEPLSVVKMGERYLLVDGYRRLRAIEDLHRIGELHDSIDLSSLPALVHENISPAVARFMVDIRQDIPYSLRAHYIRRLMKDHGRTKDEIAKLYGISTVSIKNWLVILRCVPNVQKAIDRNRYPMTAAMIFCALTEKGQENLHERLRKYQKVTRETVNREASRLPKALFRIPDKLKRKKIAKSLIEKRKGYVNEDRTELRVRKKRVMDDIVVAEKEHAYLQQEVKSYSNVIREYATVAEIWLRTTEIRQYIENNYPRYLHDISEIISIELGTSV